MLLPIYFIVATLILEVVTFHLLEFGFLPEYFLYNLALIALVAFFVYIIPNFVAQYVIYSIILFVQAVFAYLNYSLFKIYGDLFSLDMILLVGEAGAAITTNFVYFHILIQLVAIITILLAVGGIILKYCRSQKISVKQHFSVVAVVVFVLVQCVSCCYFLVKRNDLKDMYSMQDSNYVESDTFLVDTSLLKRKSYQRFGTYGYFSHLLAGVDYDKEMQEAAIEYFNSANTYDGNVYLENEKSKKIFGNGENNNVIVIMMESLEWFCFGDGNYDSSISNLSDELTPNIYNLINSNRSMISTNFYAKSKTNISEIYGILGSYPVGMGMNSLAGKNYNDDLDTLGYSMPNILKKEGYTTTYIHSNEISFYDRDKTHNNLGFETVVGKDRVLTKNGETKLTDKEGNVLYDGNDLKWDHWEAEGDFVRNTIDYIVPKTYAEKPFYSYYLNVSSHGSYQYKDTEKDCVRYVDYVKYGKENCVWDETKQIWKKKEDVLETEYSSWYNNVIKNYYETDKDLLEELLYYECGVVGLDEAIGVIIDKLKEYNIYDNTTLLLYSDHYCYYESLSNRLKNIPEEDIFNIELNTIPMIISSPCLEAYSAINYPNRDTEYLINDRFSSAYDIIPTLFDVLGVEFNENLYMGQSLFKPSHISYEADNKMNDLLIYYSNTGGLVSNHIYTYDMETFVKDGVGQEVEDMFKLEANHLLKKLNYINIMNRHSLYEKISKK